MLFSDEGGIIIYPIFHVALPLIITEIPKIKRLRINKISLIIGALLPDIIDKPLLFLGLGMGRSFSHSLLFLFVSFLIVHFVTKRNKSISLALFTGITAHMILDLPDVPFFYPFISYEFPIVEEPILYWFIKLFTDPFTLITEITGILFIGYIVINNKLYQRNDLSNYLKGTHQSLN
ncbi:MAG: metal-dependent hydrolase [Candidatus Hermodarchaeota archaeon]